MGSFIGRDAEFALLSASLTRSINGEGANLSVIEGEPGIGKTRLCEELEQLGRQSGVRTVWGRSQETSGEPEYWPLTQVIRSLMSNPGFDSLLSRAKEPARRIAAHIPELRELHPGELPPSGPSPEREQFLLQDSICALVCEFAVESPLLLILEDLQWADSATITTLAMLSEHAEARRVSIVANTRPSDPAAPNYSSLIKLKRARNCTGMFLGALGEMEVDELFRSITPLAGNERGSQAVWQLTEGNPLFVTELASSWDQLDLTRSISLPASAMELVNSKLATVESGVVDVLHKASAIGREFDSAVLLRVCGPNTDEPVSRALEEGLRLRLLEELESATGNYRFAHEITRQVLYRRNSPSQRARVHATVADVLESHFGRSAANHSAEIATHWHKSGDFGDTERGGRWALMAGFKALGAYGFEAANEHFGQALKAGEQINDPRLIAESNEGIGRSLVGLEHGGEAVEFLGEAFEYYVQTDEIHRAVGIAQMYVASPSGLSAMTPIQERALQIEGLSEIDVARVKVTLARALAVVHDNYSRAKELLQEVIDVARKSNDLALEMYAVGHGVQIAGFHRQFGDIAEFGGTVFSLASKIDDQFSVSAACAPTSLVAFWQGRSAEADTLIERGNNSAARTRVSHRISTAAHYGQRVAVERCRWEEARNAATVSMSTGFADPRTLSLAAATEFQTGNIEAGESQLREFLRIPRDERRGGESSAKFFYLVARSTADPAHFAITRSEAEDAVRAPNALSRVTGLTALAWLAVEQQDSESALHIRDQLIAAGLEEFEQSVLPALAHVAGLQGEVVEEFETLLPMFENRGMTLTAAWMKYDFARFLRDYPGTPSGVPWNDVASEGMAYATSHGLTPLANRFQELLSATSSNEPTHGLSRRELEVLMLVAIGRSNREIAVELFISPATVNRHVSNVFRKLGVTNRAAATTVAHRIGLVQ